MTWENDLRGRTIPFPGKLRKYHDLYNEIQNYMLFPDIMRKKSVSKNQFGLIFGYALFLPYLHNLHVSTRTMPCGRLQSVMDFTTRSFFTACSRSATAARRGRRGAWRRTTRICRMTEIVVISPISVDRTVNIVYILIYTVDTHIERKTAG